MRKLFEATLVALGVLRGELRLDDPVNNYVTELHGDYIGRVTIGQLVTHTSGLLLPTDHPPWPNASYSLAEFLGMLNAWTPHAGEQPGDLGAGRAERAHDADLVPPLGDADRQRVVNEEQADHECPAAADGEAGLHAGDDVVDRLPGRVGRLDFGPVADDGGRCLPHGLTVGVGG